MPHHLPAAAAVEPALPPPCVDVGMVGAHWAQERERAAFRVALVRDCCTKHRARPRLCGEGRLPNERALGRNKGDLQRERARRCQKECSRRSCQGATHGPAEILLCVLGPASSLGLGFSAPAGVPKQKWAQVRTKFMRVLLVEHDNILRSYQAQKHGSGIGMKAIAGQRTDFGPGPV